MGYAWFPLANRQGDILIDASQVSTEHVRRTALPETGSRGVVLYMVGGPQAGWALFEDWSTVMGRLGQAKAGTGVYGSPPVDS